MFFNNLTEKPVKIVTPVFLSSKLKVDAGEGQLRTPSCRQNNNNRVKYDVLAFKFNHFHFLIFLNGTKNGGVKVNLLWRQTNGSERRVNRKQQPVNVKTA